jgi:hypothetical protein
VSNEREQTAFETGRQSILTSAKELYPGGASASPKVLSNFEDMGIAAGERAKEHRLRMKADEV